MKLFPLICYVILLLVLGLHTHADGDIIHSEVYFDNLTSCSWIVIFDEYIIVDISSVGRLNQTREDPSVSVNESSPGAANINISGSGSAIFSGGFGILELDYNSVHLNLVPDSNKSVVTVTNNTDAQVQWQNQDRLLITPILRETRWRAGHAEYQVRVRSVEGLKDKVIILIAANGQRVGIDVKYERDKTSITSHKAMDTFLRVC